MQLAMLESLPVELIQHIFFYSFDVNMPRASFHLARALSKPSIYNALVLFAYFDADEELPVEEHHFRPAEYRHISLEDKLKLQQEIPRCKWFSLDWVRTCMPTLSRLQMYQAWHREHDEEMRLKVDTLQGKSVPQAIAVAHQLIASLPPINDVDAMEKHFLAKLNYESQFDSREVDEAVGADGYLTRIMQWSSMVIEKDKLHKTFERGVSILAARVIPDDLLRGNPWTAESLTLLMLLRQGMRFLFSRTIVISAPMLFEGMTSAILSGNTKALLVLLEIHYETMRLADPEIVTERSQQRPDLIGPFSYPLPLALFHTACSLPLPQSVDVLALLVREGIDSIPGDDNVITSWCLHNPQMLLSRFLRQHMESVQTYGLQAGEKLFTCGRLTWRVSGRQYPFPDTTFRDEIGYIRVGGGTETYSGPHDGLVGTT